MSEQPSGIVSTVGEDGVLRITIDRADVGNSLSPLAREALTEALILANDPIRRPCRPVERNW